MLFNNYITGLNLVLLDSDIDIKAISVNFKNFVAVNLSIEKSIIMKGFIKKNKLKVIPNSISSFSEFPNELLTVSIELLKDKDIIFIGTYGLSYESICEIFTEIYNLHKDSQKIIFICHPRKLKLGKPEILNINNSNIEDLLFTLSKL